MEKTIEIKATPQEVANLLFDLDNKQVAEVFALWTKLFEDEYQRRKEAGEQNWIFGLDHFMLYVVKELDDDGKKLITSMYSHLIYTMVSDIHKKHILELS